MGPVYTLREQTTYLKQSDGSATFAGKVTAYKSFNPNDAAPYWGLLKGGQMLVGEKCKINLNS